MPNQNRLQPINLYVGITTGAALVFYASSWAWVSTQPDWWGVIALTTVAFLLEISSTRLRTGEAAGSISFLSHLAALLLFNPFWAVTVTGVSTLVGQVVERRPLTRVAFNTGQRMLAVLIAASVYSLVRGVDQFALLGSPSDATWSFDLIVRDLLGFLLAAIAYFVSNSVAVSGAVALSNRRRFLEVWKTNTFWVFGYDIAASALAILIAWFYTLFANMSGLARLGFLAVFLPIILVKHIYGKLNTLQGLYEQLDSAHARLEQNMREQLALMVKSIEARDPYTSGHSRRVAVLSRTIARELGLAEDQVVEVENAALMHDVGKIHAEFAPLLSKEGKLTPEEWEVMKTHSVKSEELVAMFSRFHGTVQAAVRSHHERWDGLGYPDGIGSTDIPIGARIIMVADTIDAMTTERPYRKALGFDVVIAELNKHRGTQFDPELVDCTVNSVSIRRLATTHGTVLTDDDLPRTSAKPVSQRSHESFFRGRRTQPGA